jgi:xylan 1,4-beta-xylosidase
LYGFPGKTLDPQWQFWKGYDLNRVRLEGGELTLTALGDSIQATSALTRAAMDRRYTVEVEVEISPGCEAGLLLFYDNNNSCGLRLTSDPHPKSKSRTTVVSATRATLRIVNDDQVADFFYRVEDGNSAGKWTHVRASLDVTFYQENFLRGFLDLRPALYACGTGSATFRHWKYVPKALV